MKGNRNRYRQLLNVIADLKDKSSEEWERKDAEEYGDGDIFSTKIDRFGFEIMECLAVPDQGPVWKHYVVCVYDGKKLVEAFSDRDDNKNNLVKNLYEFVTSAVEQNQRKVQNKFDELFGR
jgi:hypothetical protein